MWTIRLPLKVQISKTKSFTLNLNYYRNAHFRVLSVAKVEFGLLVRSRLKDIPVLDSCTLRYVLFTPNKRKVDVSNVCSVVDKFFCDVFVNAGKIPDDDYEHLQKVTYEFGGIDPVNPRVDVIITPGEIMKPTKENEMQITLVQHEIETALEQYVRSIIKLDAHQKLSIDLTAGRGQNGFTATFDIVNAEPEKTEVADKPAPVAASKPQAAKAAEPEAQKAEAKEATNEEGKSLFASADKNEEAAPKVIQQDDAASEQNEVQTKGPSLFANLAKPKND